MKLQLKTTISLLLSIMCLYSFEGNSQEKLTINGTLEDASNGEGLIGATIFVKELNTGGATNVYGFYSITVPRGTYTLVYSYIGYEPITREVILNKNQIIDLELSQTTNQIQEIVISSEKKDDNIKSSQMSVSKLDIKEAQLIPVILGEQDVIKTIQLLPGIKSSEGGGGFYVRGGSSDQNLILLDEAPVYNASHLLGFFSVFNSTAIKDLSVYKGHIPAEYGGRASSVLDIKMKDGNSKKFTGEGGIGLISSRGTIEGPIVKDKGSFIVSARRTYLDLFLKASKDKNTRESTLFFYDLNAKANYRIGKKDRLFISGYYGRDKFGFGDQFGFDWGNTTATLRWNHLFNEKIFSNTTLLFSNYNYDIELEDEKNKEDGVTVNSAIKDFSIKQDFTLYQSPKNTIKFGAIGTFHVFLPGEVKPKSESNINAFKLDEKHAWESSIYISDDLALTELLHLNVGVRYSMFSQVGPGEIYTYDNEGERATSKDYDKGDIVKNYSGLEPRIGLRYLLNESSSIKTSYGRNRQYLHLISNSNSGTPTDLWIPSSNNVKPQIADQYALGYYKNFKENTYESSVEVYYKNMQNQIDYRTGAELTLNADVESQLLTGVGWSYGAEFFIKKRSGRLTGWISYTWAKTERKFDKIDDGEVYPANWDRTHDISVVGIYKWNEKWSFSSAFTFRTGNAVTYPVGKYKIEGEVVNLYNGRNNDRMPNYHRLDVGATKTLKSNMKYESSLTFSVYNLYGRKNAYIINFEESESDPTKTEAVKISLFSVLPSVTYNFKFK